MHTVQGVPLAMTLCGDRKLLLRRIIALKFSETSVQSKNFGHVVMGPFDKYFSPVRSG